MKNNSKKKPASKVAKPSFYILGLRTLIQRYVSVQIDVALDSRENIQDQLCEIFKKLLSEEPHVVEAEVRDLFKSGFAPCFLDRDILQRIESDPDNKDRFAIDIYGIDDKYAFSVNSRDIEF